MEISPKLAKRVKSCQETRIHGLQKDIKACENIMKTVNEEITHLKTQHNTDVKTIIKEFKEDLETKMNTLEKKVDIVIENKKVESVSYAKAVSTHEENQSTKTFEENSTAKEEEEKLIQSTACNLIFHGLEESFHYTEASTKLYDGEFLNYKILRNQLGLENVRIAECERIGKFTKEKENENKFRPVKVRFENVGDKNEVLKSLTKIKGTRHVYRVTEDLTRNERNKIKEWCKKADEMNAKIEDKKHKWKVRGSPRTKLYLKKITNKDGKTME